MPNGKSGDHPLTDILHHGAEVFGPAIDGLVRELAAAPGFDGVRDQVAELLWDNWPAWRNVASDLPAVRIGLEAIRRKLSGNCPDAEPQFPSNCGGIK